MPRTREWLGDAALDCGAFPTVEEFLVAAEIAPEQRELAQRLQNRIDEEVMSRLETGGEMLERCRGQKAHSTGCAGLDALLGDGLRQGHVYELYGLSATGKTQICHCACAQSLKQGERVIYIDTTNSFSAQRVVDFMDLEEEQAKAFLNGVEVYRVHDVYAFRQLVDQLHEMLSRMEKTPAVLIVDSISAVLASVCSYESSQGYGLIECVGRALRAMADACNIAILVTNHEVRKASASNDRSKIGESGAPALGNIWKNQVHARIHIQRHDACWKTLQRDGRTVYMRLNHSQIETLD